MAREGTPGDGKGPFRSERKVVLCERGWALGDGSGSSVKPDRLLRRRGCSVRGVL